MSGSNASLRTDARVVRWFTIDLVLVVLTQKFAIPLGESGQIALALVIHLSIVAYLLLQGCVFVSGRRLVAFSVFAAIATIVQMRLPAPSFESLVLMLATASMFIFVTHVTADAFHLILDRFVRLALLAAALVGVDWAFQVLGSAMPSLEAIMPKALVYTQYNYIQPIVWGSPWVKPNGLFFLETSHVSQFIAMGLVIEGALFRRPLFAIALATGLLTTYGGTGMTLLLVCVLSLLVQMGSRFVLIALLAAPLLVGLASVAGVADNFMSRSGEFFEETSSGYNRFILPAKWTLDALTGPQDRAWLGDGAGAMPKAAVDDAGGGLAWPPYTKITVEYGAIALIAWLVYLSMSVFGDGVPFVICWMAFFQYSFLNGSLNVPIHTIYCVLLCAGYVLSDRGRLSMAPAKTISRTNERFLKSG